MKKSFTIGQILFSILLPVAVYSQSRVVDKHIYHLRSSDKAEWNDGRNTRQKSLVIYFTAKQNEFEQTLALRQEDVRQKWTVRLNEIVLGTLQQDEKTMLSYFAIPSKTLKDGKNELSIRPDVAEADDISAGEIILADQPLNNLLNEASVEISVTDRKSNTLIPARFTLVNSQHVLQPVAAIPDPLLAVRTGCIYTGSGKASFRLPAGNYILYAGRGFQYSVDSIKLTVRPGDNIKRNLSIEKELPLDGWIPCDTHIHTLTYSGHGDATMHERIITLAGEGIELPVITEHNFCADIDSLSRALKLRKYFTPVAGDEYTSPVGHFNIFPLRAGAAVPDHRVGNWNEVSLNVQNNNDRPAVMILNHARDIHNNFRPFDPARHTSPAGSELDGWKFPANSMEVINSGSQQADIMQLYRDWFGMMNGGNFLTPVGSSDSHDISRYLVGQARTFIGYNGNDPANIDRDSIVRNFLGGEVMVGFGLVAEMTINNRYGPGSIVPPGNAIEVSVKVLAPSWIEADSILLFANGQKIRGAKVKAAQARGIKWQGSWTIPAAGHDRFLVAIATGPDPLKPFWPIPKPFQPVATAWTARIIGSSGAIWIDADGDGTRTSAYDYGTRLVTRYGHNITGLIDELSAYDESVAIQAASLLQQKSALPPDRELEKLLRGAAPQVKRGFVSLLRAIGESRSSHRPTK